MSHRNGRRSGYFQERFFRSSTQRGVASSSTGQRIIAVRSSRSLWPVAGLTAVHASCMRCAEAGGAVAKIASPGSCAHAACAPGKNVALDLKQLEAITNCRWHQTGWPGSPKPDRPGQVWLADITCVQTQEGWLYLSGILDHCSRRCIGWHARGVACQLASQQERGKKPASISHSLPGYSIIPIAAFSTPAPNFKAFCTLVARPLP